MSDSYKRRYQKEDIVLGFIHADCFLEHNISGYSRKGSGHCVIVFCHEPDLKFGFPFLMLYISAFYNPR